MKLTCYVIEGEPREIVPGRSDRDWMDAFADRHPYRCLPLVVANTTGWEILCPISFTASWTGGPRIEDIRIDPDDGASRDELARIAVSHFSAGVLTFHTGYLFQTEPGWDLWVGGPPNWVKDGIQPLTGVVETDWLPFPFTMNWKFTRPGLVQFKKGDPICFIMPISHTAIDEVVPITKPITANAPLHADYLAWGQSRTSFLEKLQSRDPDTVQKGWQRDYFKGQAPEGVKQQGGAQHINRRRLEKPRPAKPGE
jgi:hypothetical protein